MTIVLVVVAVAALAGFFVVRSKGKGRTTAKR